MKKILLSFLLTLCGPTFAALVETPMTKIVWISTYNQFNGGDVIFGVESPVAGCESGFWLSIKSVAHRFQMPSEPHCFCAQAGRSSVSTSIGNQVNIFAVAPAGTSRTAVNRDDLVGGTRC
jgi:hypothetical protein